MNPDDIKAAALCMWKEARGEKDATGSSYRAMSAVGCVIQNGARRHGRTITQEVYAPYRYSSMSAPHDPQLHLEPQAGDPQYSEALDIANDLLSGNLVDFTGAATLYYSTYIPFPAGWDRSKIVHTLDLGNMRFYREIA